jgi:hypothetical protein
VERDFGPVAGLDAAIDAAIDAATRPLLPIFASLSAGKVDSQAIFACYVDSSVNGD